MQPPRRFDPYQGIVIVDPALNGQIEGRNEQTLEDQAREDAMAHAARFSSHVGSG